VSAAFKSPPMSWAGAGAEATAPVVGARPHPMLWDPARPDAATCDAPFRLYNIGNSAPVELADFTAALEHEIGRPAIRELLPLQPGATRRPPRISTSTATTR